MFRKQAHHRPHQPPYLTPPLTDHWLPSLSPRIPHSSQKPPSLTQETPNTALNGNGRHKLFTTEPRNHHHSLYEEHPHHRPHKIPNHDKENHLIDLSELKCRKLLTPAAKKLSRTTSASGLAFSILSQELLLVLMLWVTLEASHANS